MGENVEPVLSTLWNVMRPYQTAEAVRVVTEYLANDHTILAFKLLALKPGYVYEVSWVYK
jgi:hypothetical protein